MAGRLAPPAPDPDGTADTGAGSMADRAIPLPLSGAAARSRASSGPAASGAGGRRELAPLVPAAPRAALSAAACVRCSPSRRMTPCCGAACRRRACLAAAARIPLTGDAAAVAHAGRAAIDACRRRLWRRGAPRRRSSSRCRRARCCARRELPAAVEENLRQALAYDLDRHTPFKPDELHFDAVVVARDAAKKEIRVDLGGGAATVVDQPRRRAESWGATVVAVAPDAARRPGAARGSRSTCFPRTSGPRRRVATLAVLGAGRAGRGRRRWSRSCFRSGRSATTRSRCADHRTGARAGRRRERAAPAARAAVRRLQLRAGEEIRVSQRGAARSTT